jgi:hypothetical protein
LPPVAESAAPPEAENMMRTETIKPLPDDCVQTTNQALSRNPLSLDSSFINCKLNQQVKNTVFQTDKRLTVSTVLKNEQASPLTVRF